MKQEFTKPLKNKLPYATVHVSSDVTCKMREVQELAATNGEKIVWAAIAGQAIGNFCDEYIKAHRKE